MSMTPSVGALALSLAAVLPIAWSAADASSRQLQTLIGGNSGAGRYSTAEQITRENIDDLQLAWTYRTGETDPALLGVYASMEATPLLIGDLLVTCTKLTSVVALDAGTGAQRWRFDPPSSGKRRGHGNCRGVAAWIDSHARRPQVCSPRVLFAASDLVFALDAQTGKPCAAFGRNGIVRMDGDVPVKFFALPSVVNSIAVFASYAGPVYGFDVRTGALRWTFHTIPRHASDPAAPSWIADSWRGAQGGNVWPPMSADEERDLIFLPVSSAKPNYWGGNRPGNNLYTGSLVALRGSTGEVVWHYQIVHHDLWDYDLSAQPILVDLRRGNERVPAVIQGTKQGLLFVFHRATGEPLFPIEERPVPQHGAPRGEWLSPTQPFPTTIAPLIPQTISPDDAWGFTFYDRGACREKIAALSAGAAYLPPSERGIVKMPPSSGGVQWSAGAYDPQTQLFIVPTTRVAQINQLIAAAVAPRLPPDAARDFRKGVLLDDFNSPYKVRQAALLSPFGAPCHAPPWGALTAVDLTTGAVRWDIPLGTIERETRKKIGIPLPLKLGTPNSGGPITTAAGLTFIAATLDDRIRAFDTRSGEELWSARLPAGGQATPLTYMLRGRQYLVISAGGHGILGSTLGDYIVAYALP